MGNEPGTTRLLCLECGAANPREAGHCWVCRAPLHAGGKEPAAPWSPRADGEESPWVVPLLVFAGLAVLFGLGRESPGLAVLLGVVFVPALVFTLAAAEARARTGVPMGGREKLLRFARSALLTFFVLAALGVALVISLVALVAVICSGVNFH